MSLYPMLIEQVEDGGNGYGWSVVSLGNGIFELMVLKDGDPCYHTPITNDVFRGDWIEVNQAIDRIEELETVK